MLILLKMLLIIKLICLIMMFINYMISKKKNDREKSSPFECGFDPITSSRLPFSIHFYLIAIIFLIFDVEIVIFLPMIPSFLLNNTFTWVLTSLFFSLILILGVYIEWNSGALNWLK